MHHIYYHYQKKTKTNEQKTKEYNIVYKVTSCFCAFCSVDICMCRETETHDQSILLERNKRENVWARKERVGYKCYSGETKTMMTKYTCAVPLLLHLVHCIAESLS